MSEKGAVRYSEEVVIQYLDAHCRISTSDHGDPGRLRLLASGSGAAPKLKP